MKNFLILAFVSAFLFTACTGNAGNNEEANAELTLKSEAPVASMDENDQMEADKKQIEEYLKNNDISYKVTEDNIYYHVAEEGSGRKPTSGEYVKVHYTGTLLNGKKFDSSKDRNDPFIFQLGTGRVIKGWDNGIPLFNKGGSGTLYLPSGVGYGARAMGDAIPANSILVFEIELLDIMNETEYKAYMAEYREKKMKEQEEYNKKQLDTDLAIVKQYIADSGLKNVKSTESGLHYIVEEQGAGKKVVAGKDISVHYTGTLLDGTKFDSSIDRGEPITFPLGAGRVIKGWDEGLMLFNVGGKGKLIIPSPLAYGQRAAGQIPANSVLIFDIEVVSQAE